jgi:hypothetical protein
VAAGRIETAKQADFEIGRTDRAISVPPRFGGCGYRRTAFITERHKVIIQEIRKKLKKSFFEIALCPIRQKRQNQEFSKASGLSRIKSCPDNGACARSENALFYLEASPE